MTDVLSCIDATCQRSGGSLAVLVCPYGSEISCKIL